MSKCNRSQKRQEKRKLHRMVRKFSPVLALQERTYQEGLTATNGHFHSDDNTGKKENLKIASLNCKGANHISAREKVVHMMKTHKLDILFSQETHINTNTEEHHGQYCFVFSSSITDQQREEACIKQEKWRKQ